LFVEKVRLGHNALEIETMQCDIASTFYCVFCLFIIQHVY